MLVVDWRMLFLGLNLANFQFFEEPWVVAEAVFVAGYSSEGKKRMAAVNFAPTRM